MKSYIEWVVMGHVPNTAMCKRCGEKLVLGCPIPVGVFLAASRDFIKIHSACKQAVDVEPST